MKHKGLYAFGLIACVIVAAVLYMFGVIQGGRRADTVYFVSKTSSENSTFWHSVERGVNVAADELGLEVVFVGPEREIDLADQIAFVEEGISKEPMAIILAASDYNGLVEVSEKVVEAKITFVTIDSDVNMIEDHSFIATDNIAASKILGETLAEAIGGEGLVGIVSHLEGTTSAFDREEGFLQGIESYEGIQVIEEIPYSNNDAQTAYVKTVDLIEKYPTVKGIFGTNEATLIGIARAVDAMGLKDQVTVVGFDISDAAASYLEKGVIHTIVIQRPFNMGYLSVKEAYDQAVYKKKPEFTNVDVVLVTKENMFDEEIQKFLIPFLE